ncbi:nitrogenase molybdenum-iron protein subunit beta NifK [Candidatus Magnetoovum chiemensis]|nr:nitrogenase molybdenum-iron protein subunit beta NifK [Candidatus Magnetoovum chiemensis]
MSIKDHNDLFKSEEYQELFARKREFEAPCPSEDVKNVQEWTKTDEYRQKNFAREVLKVNPAKACQPLGAMLCATAFENTLNFVQGAQGCCAYFRSHLSRHFKEPVAAVSSSMTEDSAVFGGLNNMLEGLENAYALYKPDMIAVSTTCMAEVIGDDLNAFLKDAKSKSKIPEDIPTPFAHTPSFVGSHITGYDNMMKGILAYATSQKKGASTDRINIIPGFDTYTGNIREIKRLLTLMNVPHTVLADISDVMDSPNTGQYKMYPGGTPIKELNESVNAKATFTLQKFSSIKTGEFIEEVWRQKFIRAAYPVGIKNTDALLALISEVTGKPIPQEIEDERGRAVDAMVDSHAYIHGKRIAMVADPDLLLGIISFLMEMGAEPVHVVCTNGDKNFKKDAEELLSSNAFGQKATVHINKDMWHLRSLMFTEPVDLLIGNSYAKFLWRDTATPLVRIGFPIFDRHHLHRYPIIGYSGVINLINWTVNTVLDELDRASLNSPSFDVIR